ncbi:alanine dehydrogenase [Psychrilyobacter atlanticus]|uniref:alanine dehydrogenase n=1 Tax=Psychrilyobacter atlanticus TaxID=271091 RepID=UPI0003FDD4ED|nr:alanine dehydrogenase [Psychrilyobacter atlanticus]
MRIGIPGEIKPQEHRIALVPEGAAEFINRGHNVYMTSGAANGIGLTDEDYKAVGVEILSTLEEVYEVSDMIVGVKEPQPRELALIKPGQIHYRYLHLAPDYDQTVGLMEAGATGIAFETVEMQNRSLPLLAPMSEVAGRESVIFGANILAKHMGGKGILLGGVTGTARAKVVVVGAGIAGQAALKMAVGLESDVTILDVDIAKLKYLDDIYGNKIKTLYSNAGNLAATIKEADLVISTVLIPGAKCPHLITMDMIHSMEAGSVIVDISIDQGGSTPISKPTYHEAPTFLTDNGVVMYCCANMPGAMPKTSSYALANVTLKYGLAIADLGVEGAIKRFPELKPGVNVYEGKLVYKHVSTAFPDLKFDELDTVMYAGK